MWVQEIWRYPVKSMAGEPLAASEIGARGIAGDRMVQVRDAAGRIVTARTKPGLLRHRATLAPEGVPLVDGRPWHAADVASDVEAAAGTGSRLVLSDDEDRFDVLPLLVITDGMLLTVGHDRRRFRANLIIGGVPGITEREWQRGQLRIGDVIIQMQDLRRRCIITTFDPDTGAQDLDILRLVQEEFGGMLGLNGHVLSSGRIAIGDDVGFTPRG